MDLRRLGARLGDLGQDVLFLLGIALDRRDQIGNKIGAALIMRPAHRPISPWRSPAESELIVAASLGQS